MNQNRQPPRQNQGYAPVYDSPPSSLQKPLQNYNNQPAQNNVRPFDNGRQNPNQGYEQSQHQAPQHYQAPINNQNNKTPKDDKRLLDRPDWFLQLNSYGGKCAFQIETSVTKDLWFTVNIESAEREDPKDPHNKRYVWANKTVLQMTKSELPIFTAVMLGLLPSARFDNHDTKFFEVINQDKNFFFKSGGQNRALHVAPVPTVDAYMFGTAALTQYCRNFNGLSTEAGFQIISRLAAQLAACGGYNQASKR
jgi:hypothetical protein